MAEQERKRKEEKDKAAAALILLSQAPGKVVLRILHIFYIKNESIIYYIQGPGAGALWSRVFPGAGALNFPPCSRAPFVFNILLNLFF